MTAAPTFACLPKAELHLHIEGTFEPELIFKIAQRNNIAIPFESVEALRGAYQFEDLQSFLYLYYQAMNVLQKEEDFYELCSAYLQRAQANGVVHVEIFFDPQAHTSRGVHFDTVVNGLYKAVKESKEKYGITSKLIMCFLRDLSAESAMDTLKLAEKHGEKIIAVGLDSAEVGNPPSKFKKVFEAALAQGLLTVAHAGEEGPPDYVWEALNDLKVSRVDHGVRSMEDPALVTHLAEHRIPLTVCPLSNVKLRVFPDLKSHNLKHMLDCDLMATVNSDDPAYFGGYVADNLEQVAQALNLSRDEQVRLAKNSIEASFLSHAEKAAYLAQIDNFCKALS
ncbi:MAG: adenosine deaminase [Cyanobacteria bacterium SZAS LIN-2]|nr:adenosine deaminase [Cyanobacteria bacterium SZAS LIN-3]MBS1995061.1 adenosine deaminase [Cyanobacteria bacterium SZAS LIN-2]